MDELNKDIKDKKGKGKERKQDKVKFEIVTFVLIFIT